LEFLDYFNKAEDPKIRQLRDIVYVYMIPFSNNPEPLKFKSERGISEFVPLGDVDPSVIKPSTQMVSISEVTCIYKALQKAREALRKFYDEAKGYQIYRPTIVLLSDGCENCDQTLFESEAEDTRATNRVFVILYGKSDNACPDLLKEAASEINQEEMDRAVKKLGDLSILQQYAKDNKFFFDIVDEKVLKVLLIGASSLLRLSGMEG